MAEVEVNGEGQGGCSDTTSGLVDGSGLSGCSLFS